MILKKIRVYVFGYRDEYFWSKYGATVRDLMFTEALAKIDIVDEIYYFNRPISIYEKMSTKKRKPKLDLPKIKFIQRLDIDLWAPLKRRGWLENCYKDNYDNIELDNAYFNLVIDFLPIGNLPVWVSKADKIWYDYIDNFIKHNRYSSRDILLVKNKYKKLRQAKNLVVTGVTKTCIDGHINSSVLTNGLTDKLNYHSGIFKFDFGFIGFITNKFDIDAIKKIAESGYTIGIYGEFYDSNIQKKLSRIKNVYINGAFNKSDVNQVLSEFKVGLIPYLIDKLHDESPLKIYQYFSSGKKVLSSTNFSINSSDLFIYDDINIITLAERLMIEEGVPENRAVEYFNNNNCKNKIECFVNNHLLDNT